jgi:hypothetical protein
MGRIVQAARSHGLKATGADIVDRGSGFPVRDFLSCTTLRDNIVTNPPYGILREFTEHALGLVRHNAGHSGTNSAIKCG